MKNNISTYELLRYDIRPKEIPSIVTRMKQELSAQYLSCRLSIREFHNVIN